jgi:hypothetical protein
MRVRGLLSLSLLAACYRGDGSPPPVNALAIATASCSTDDDVSHPVLDTNEGRLRVHSTAALTATRNRTSGSSWVGPKVPPYVDKKLGTLELMLLDQVDHGYLAFYRDPYNTGSCQLGDETNCAYEVRRYRDEHLEWSLNLNQLMSRADFLEVQDIRLSGGVLYFNEACQSYSGGAGADCSSLVAVDPVAKRVLWRTKPLTSNNRFVVRGCYIVAGYGFTAEPDAVFLVDRANGRVLQTIPVASAPEGYKLVGPGQVDVTLYSGTVRRYRLENITQPGGKLVALDGDDPDLYGGAAYGGGMYGGLGYAGRRRNP